MDCRVKGLAGQVFGLLTVIKYAGVDAHRQALWLCRCSCGGSTVARSSKLQRGKVSHCGCLTNTHGMSGTPTCTAWFSMRYAAAVCGRWCSFGVFYADMGDRPAGTVLCRIDSSQPCSLENCCWWTQAEKKQHTEKRIAHDGRTLSVSKWAELAGLSVVLFRSRLNNGWPMERALQPKMQTLGPVKSQCTPNLYVPWNSKDAVPMSDAEIAVCVRSMMSSFLPAEHLV